MSERSRETSSTSAWARSRFDQKSGAARRPSIAARSFWSFSTSKKPPQLADTRFQILGIGDGDFSWHNGKIVQFPANRKGCESLSARRIARFWFRSARGLEAKNCFAFFHQIETSAGNRFRVG